MKNSAKILFFFIILLVMAGLVFWGYNHRTDDKPNYSGAFEHQYENSGKDREKDEKEYHGSKEKDIRKWKGNRYSTY